MLFCCLRVSAFVVLCRARRQLAAMARSERRRCLRRDQAPAHRMRDQREHYLEAVFARHERGHAGHLGRSHFPDWQGWWHRRPPLCPVPMAGCSGNASLARAKHGFEPMSGTPGVAFAQQRMAHTSMPSPVLAISRASISKVRRFGGSTLRNAAATSASNMACTPRRSSTAVGFISPFSMREACGSLPWTS